MLRQNAARTELHALSFKGGAGWCPLVLRVDLIVNLPHQHVRYNLLEVFVVHESSKNLLILIHAINEQTFQGLLENKLEIVQSVGQCCLL